MVEKLAVLDATGEVSTAAQHQFLLHGAFKTIMTLLDIAVLVRLTRLDLLTYDSVIAQQSFVTIGKLCRIRHVVHCRRHPVRPMPLRNLAQFPDRVLKPFAQAFETL